jgi:hypothetical protein
MYFVLFRVFFEFCPVKNPDGLFLEYNAKNQSLHVSADMKVSITDVNSVEVQDTSMCVVSKSDTVHTYDVFYYEGINNRNEYFGSCDSVDFSSPFAVDARKSCEYVSGHGKHNAKVYNVTF